MIYLHIMRKDKNTSKNEINMTEGALLPKILLFIFPLIASSTLQLLFNAADIIVVGRYAGSEALAAVGSNTALITLSTNVFIGLSIGSNVVCAKYLGARKVNEVKETIHTSVALALYGGIILTLIGLFFSVAMLHLMATPDEILPLSSLYLKLYFLGMPALLLYNFGAAILRSVGDTRRPLVYLLFAGIVNILLNLFFVIVLHLSVAGVALATVISQYLSAILVLRCLVISDSSIHMNIRDCYKINRHRLGEIFRVGIPAGLQGVVFSISNVLIQSSINSFGAIAVAGNTAAANLEGFIYMAMNASYQACVSFTSQNYGAKKWDRVLRVLILCELMGIITGLVLSIPTYVFGNNLLSIYSSDTDVITFGMRRLAVVVTTYALCEVMEVPVGTLRGMGYGLLPMIISLIGACLFRVVWIFTIFKLNPTPEILYISYPISWTLTAIAQILAVAYAWRHKG